MNKSMENISCSDLIKKSAKTICYFRKKRKLYTVTEVQINGNINAEKKSISELKEMRGTYNINDNLLLHYTIDEIINEKDKLIFIEHKHIEDNSIIEDWYLHYSIGFKRIRLYFY